MHVKKLTNDQRAYIIGHWWHQYELHKGTAKGPAPLHPDLAAAVLVEAGIVPDKMKPKVVQSHRKPKATDSPTTAELERIAARPRKEPTVIEPPGGAIPKSDAPPSPMTSLRRSMQAKKSKSSRSRGG